jgi:hypothetical protein
MAGALNISPNASDSEVASLGVVAGLLPATWTVVLQEPQGGRGGGAGNTGDLAIYRGGSVHGVYQGGDDDGAYLVREVGAHFTVDVYTPDGKTSSEKAAEFVRRKLSTQSPSGVCVDLVNISAAKRQTYINTAKKGINVRTQALVFHVDGHNEELIGTFR